MHSQASSTRYKGSYEMKIWIITVALASAAISSAQTVVVNRMGGYAYNSPYNRLYNQRSQITFSGVVTGVQRVKPMSNMYTGVTLLVKNNKGGGTAVVDLGPAWFVDQQVTKIKPKAKIQVTGSKVMVDGRGVILAKLVQSGKSVLALRRINGAPYWDIADPVASANLGTDPNVFEITGTLEGYRIFGEGDNRYAGLVLNTPSGNITIDLGPQWFFQPQGFVFNPGSNITVAGSGNYRLDPYSNVIPAYWFRINNRTTYLRNPQNGMGIWQGWRP